MKISTIQWNMGGGYIRREGSDPKNVDSYNVSDLDYIIIILKKYNPSIITLQETHSDDDSNQAEEIARKLGYKYFFNDVYDESHIEKGQGLGQAIISRFPMNDHSFKFFINPNLELATAKGEKWVTHNKGFSKCFVLLENGEKLCVKTLHMVPFGKFGVNPQSPEITNIIKDIERKIFDNEKNVLLQADFNLDSEYLKDFFDHNYKELRQKEITTPKGKRYDHVLYKGLENIKSEVIGDVLTDHFPIYSEFNLNN